MDLKGMLNDSGPARAKPRQQGQQQGPQQGPQQPPSTPVQQPGPPSFRDYSQTAQASPTRHVSQDFGGQPRSASNAFASPPQYHTPGPYSGRPQPPTLQQLPPNDLRSPSISAGGLAPSPYRQTPTSSISAGSGGYPFPPSGQTPTSPVQLHQYPPQNAYHRDSYPQPSGPVGMTAQPGAPSYVQGQPVPQTPPVGTTGVPHPYLHQRSQSTHSISTPTSAQSQGQYGAPFVQGSPTTMAHPLPTDQHHRQPSQPPTPLGPPMAGPRQSSGSYAQPPSPYQQRLSSTGSYGHLQTAQVSPSQNSPPPPPPPALPRHSSAQNIYDPQLAADAHRRSQSQSERGKSQSVSPKTRIPSLPSSAGGHPATARSDSESHYLTHPSTTPTMMADTLRHDRATTPAKRKLDDRELKQEELEKRDVRPPPFEKVNGHNPSANATPVMGRVSLSPAIQKKRRKIRYQSPPVWAQSLQTNRKLNAANFVLHKPVHDHVAELNGRNDAKQERMSRHASPEEKRAAPAPVQAPPVQPPPVQPPPVQPPPAPQAVPEPPNLGKPLGPWEQSLLGTRPMDDITKAVADFLYMNVVANDRMGEINSRGIEFEIEAKLGTLIDRQTNQRMAIGVQSECVLSRGEAVFRSSMTEAQHMHYNEFLNEMVKSTFPMNRANGANARLPVEYKHRREIDRFFELPSHLRQQLPPCVETLIPSHHSIKVRVSYDEKTKDVLAKIVKARVADLDIFMPRGPLDLRISVNLEMAWETSVAELERLAVVKKRETMPDRNKDRLSYQHGPYQIDLTQVKSASPANLHRPSGVTEKDSDKEHELEIELSAPTLLDQASRLSDGRDNQFTDLVEGFINNARLLSRKAGDFRP